MKSNIIVLFSLIVLSILVSLEFLFIRFSCFDLFPHIGIFFHLTGGICSSLLICQLFVHELKQVKLLTKSIFVLGSVSLLAIGWEGFEWILGYSLVHTNMQGSLDNTMLDLFIGIFASLIGLFVQRLLDRILTNKFFK